LNISNFGTQILLDMINNRNETQASSTSEAAAKMPSKIGSTEVSMNEFPIKFMMNELMGVIKEQNALVRSLPTEVQTLVNQTIADAQPAQGEVQSGITIMVKIPNAISKDLAVLADQLSTGKMLQDVTFEQLKNVPEDILKNSAETIKNIVNAIGNDNQANVQKLLISLPLEVQQVIQTMTGEKQLPSSTNEMPQGITKELLVLAEHLEKGTVPEKTNSKIVELVEAVNSLPTKILQESAQTVRKIAETMSAYEPLSGSFDPKGSAVATFTLPLYFEPNKLPYPAYVHVYHQEEREGSGNGTVQKKETWMRFCVGTENIGIVDVMFHLYGDNQLDIKIGFANNTSANEFKDYIPHIEQSLSETPINLATISVGGQQ